MPITYSFFSVTTSLLDLSAIDVFVLPVVLIVGEKLFLLVHKLIVLHWTYLSVAHSAHIQHLSVRLEILQKAEGKKESLNI